MKDKIQVIFSHGKESGPNGRKILAMRKIAEQMSCDTYAPSYEGIFDLEKRIEILYQESSNLKNIVLVGSSMGAYISTVASEKLNPLGVFLLAPAFYIPDYPQQEPIMYTPHKEIVHGWKDELIPASKIIHYAEKFEVPLHLLSSGHRLDNVIPEIESLFGFFLQKLIQSFRND